MCLIAWIASLQMYNSGSFSWSCPTCESFYPHAPLCILVMALFFLLQSSPIINCIDFPIVASCPLFTSTVCMCGCVEEAVCGSLLAQMLVCVCTVCKSGASRVAQAWPRLCRALSSERLQQCHPPQPWPANLTNKDLGHLHASTVSLLTWLWSSAWSKVCNILHLVFHCTLLLLSHHKQSLQLLLQTSACVRVCATSSKEHTNAEWKKSGFIQLTAKISCNHFSLPS